MRNFRCVVLLFSILISCHSKQPADPRFQEALDNGYLAHEGFVRSLRFVEAWLEHADPTTGLIPRNLMASKDFWNAQDAAADNYPFMVLTAYLLDKELFEGKMRSILSKEQELTNWVDRLPDDYSFSQRGFRTETVNMDGIVFGSSEYIKDGLLPLTEYLGESPWSDRMIGMLDDIWKHASYDTPFGKIPSTNVEVNGELLQTLSRVYWMTGNSKYLEWAIRLGDYYLMGDQHPTRDLPVIRLRDHGCEIVSGLSELYVTLAYSDPAKRELYRPHLYEMLDRILEVGRNEHGFFYNQVNPISGEVLDPSIADTWGYTLNAYYSIFLVDGHQAYREPVYKVFQNLRHYEFFDWENGSADGYADAIESALNLLNREPSQDAESWINSQIQVMWSMQDSAYRGQTELFRGTGIIEGWHGDGNFARTTIMHSLWKTQGTSLSPWHEKAFLGAKLDGKELEVSMLSEEPYSGMLKFDYPRHRANFNLPLDYPRINQFPEWFVISAASSYLVHFVNEGKTRRMTGTEILEGIPVELVENVGYYLIVEPVEN
ncbi:hypothetical protein [Lunatimonas salinarum]|uniref:hypothetical protein n=1 Tax=Lunatimonas salinarum TaxID=1774590 RepID=UPI001FD7BB64|nr:hypothetical protein [Lunatimonas salinarum]